MKSYFSIKPGATFFLGSSRTLVYHKDDVEIIYKTKTPSGKTYYAHVYLMLGGENSVTLYADWGDYFLHLSSIRENNGLRVIAQKTTSSITTLLKIKSSYLMPCFG